MTFSSANEASVCGHSLVSVDWGLGGATGRKRAGVREAARGELSEPSDGGEAIEGVRRRDAGEEVRLSSPQSMSVSFEGAIVLQGIFHYVPLCSVS